MRPAQTQLVLSMPCGSGHLALVLLTKCFPWGVSLEIGRCLLAATSVLRSVHSRWCQTVTAALLACTGGAGPGEPGPLIDRPGGGAHICRHSLGLPFHAQAVLDQENPDLFKWLTGQQEAPSDMLANPAFIVSLQFHFAAAAQPWRCMR